MAAGPHAPTPLALGSGAFQLTLGGIEWRGAGLPLAGG